MVKITSFRRTFCASFSRRFLHEVVLSFEPRPFFPRFCLNEEDFESFFSSAFWVDPYCSSLTEGDEPEISLRNRFLEVTFLETFFSLPVLLPAGFPTEFLLVVLFCFLDP